MAASELIERVAQLAEGFVDRVPDQMARDLRAILKRLREPVRVAVVGRVKAGKSTIVNALLGQCVAPTDVSECTRLVTWFRYGYPQRVTLEMKDGSEVETQLDSAGLLPAELPVPVDDVAAIHAFLTNDVLKDVTLIDTPGIGSVHKEFSSGTEKLLDETAHTAAATSQADAVVFLLNQVVMDDERRALELLASGAESEPGSAANTVGLLSKADKLGEPGNDPWTVALELANKFSERFAGEMSTVVPVIGLLAETSEAATLTEPDARNLAELGAMDPKDLAPLLWSPDRFVDGEAPLPAPARQRLLELLDLYGIEQAVRIVRGGESGATSLRRQLSRMSGIAEVRQVLNAMFSTRDDVLKVRSILELLLRISYERPPDVNPAVLQELRSRVEALRLEPAMHKVAELEAWHAYCTGKVTLPGRLAEEFERLMTPGSVAVRLGAPEGDRAAAESAARDALVRWRTFMVTEANPGQANLARVVLRSYQLALSSTGEPQIASVPGSTGR